MSGSRPEGQSAGRSAPAAEIEDAIKRSLGGFGTDVEEALFGGVAETASALESFCVEFLGSPVRACLFYSSHIGAAAGLELADGRRLVVKAHQTWMSDAAHLRAVVLVQRRLASAGFPCPRPLLGPVPLGAGLATVEEFLDQGEERDAHQPSVRPAMAKLLHHLLCVAGSPPSGMGPGFLQRHHDLYPRPHHRRYDFEATAAGAEWIDRRAAEALAVLRDARMPNVVGHHDWSTKHLRWEGNQVVAVYDWDSLGVAPEPVVVANAAAHFSATWDIPVSRVWPTAGEREAFLADYQAARGRAFTHQERRIVDAAVMYQLAYTSRVEHSINQGEWLEDSCRQLLSELSDLA
jgi:Phosphotransferase enzyme family